MTHHPTSVDDSVVLPAGHRGASRARWLVTLTLEVGLAAASTAAAWVATASLFLTAVVAAILLASQALVAVRAWRDRDLGLADWAFNGAVIGAGLGAGFQGQPWWGMAVLLGNALVVAVTNLNPAVVDRVAHSWWTPAGAAAHAAAVAAWDAAHRLRDNPRYDNATIDDLVDAFAQDRRHAAAAAVDEPLYATRDPRRDDVVCRSCTTTISAAPPCAAHTPRLYQAYLDDQYQSQR